MAIESTGSTPAEGQGTTSAPAGTTGQGATESNTLLAAPPAAKAGGTAEAVTPQDGATKAAAGAEGGEKPTGETPPADIELKLPEGFKPDEAALGEFKTIAKEAGLKGEVAQKVFDLYAKHDAAQAAAREAQAHAQAEARNKEWAAAARADKEYGGAAFDSNLTYAQKAIAKFGSKELLSWFNESGAGNHPEVVRTFIRMGKAISEDNTRGASSSGGVSSEEAILKVRYPTMHKEN
jgi:hypothetical protein